MFQLRLIEELTSKTKGRLREAAILPVYDSNDDWGKPPVRIVLAEEEEISHAQDPTENVRADVSQRQYVSIEVRDSLYVTDNVE